MPGFNFPKYIERNSLTDFSSAHDLNPQAEWEERRQSRIGDDMAGYRTNLPFHRREDKKYRKLEHPDSADVEDDHSTGMSKTSSASNSLSGNTTSSSLAIEEEVSKLLTRASEQMKMEMRETAPAKREHVTDHRQVNYNASGHSGETKKKNKGFGSYRDIVFEGIDDNSDENERKTRKSHGGIERKQSSQWHLDIPFTEYGQEPKPREKVDSLDLQANESRCNPSVRHQEPFPTGQQSCSDDDRKSPCSLSVPIVSLEDTTSKSSPRDSLPDSPLQTQRSYQASPELTPRYRPRPLLFLDENNTLQQVHKKGELVNILNASESDHLPAVAENIKEYFDKFQDTPIDGIQHYANTGSYMHTLYNEERLVDTIITVGQNRFGAHRAVLSCYSEYLADLFREIDGKQRLPVELRLRGVDPSAFRVFLDFAYSGRLEMQQELAVDLMKMAENLRIASLKNRCMNFVEHLPNRDIILLLANFRNVPEGDIFIRALSCVSNRFTEVTDCDIFLHLDIDTVCAILSHDQLIVNSELNVFCAGVKWITFKQGERLGFLTRIMKCVRFTLMTQEELLQAFAKSDLIKENKTCKQMVLEANWVLTANYLKMKDPLHLRQHNPRIYEGYPKSASCDAFFSAHEFLHPEVNAVSASSSVHTTQWDNINAHATTSPVSQYNGSDFLAVGDFNEADSFKQNRHMNKIEGYSTATNEWDHLSVLPEPRLYHAITMLDDNLYLVGGKVIGNYTEGFEVPSKEAFVYSPGTNQWKRIAPMNTARMYHSLCTLNGMIYAVGGQDEQNRALNSVECYDPLTDNWFYVKPMSVARYGASAAELGGRLYIAGGCNTKGGNGQELTVLDSMECYDPHSNKWTFRNRLRLSRCHANMVAVDGKLFMCGGATCGYQSRKVGLTSIADVDVYIVENDSWSLKTSLKVPRHNCGSVVVDNKIYIIGGASSACKSVLQSVECYDVIRRKWLGGITDLPYQAQWITCVAVRRND